MIPSTHSHEAVVMLQPDGYDGFGEVGGSGYT